jgi:DNA-binding MarR family transcriptional regulator
MYNYFLTKKESTILAAMEVARTYSASELSLASRLAPTEIAILVDGLIRRGLIEQTGAGLDSTKLTVDGASAKNRIINNELNPFNSTSSVLITDDESAARMRKNLESDRLESDLDEFIGKIGSS